MSIESPAVSRAVALFGEDGLSPEDPTPLYVRLQERIRGAIEHGMLKPREALPAERDIAAALKVSRVTVRKALVELVRAGLLQQRRGSGTFVAPPARRIEQALSHLTSFNEDMRLRGLVPTARWLDRGISLPTPEEAMRLLVSPRETVARLRRLRLADGVPMAIERACLPTRWLPDPEVVDQSLYAVLEARGIRPVRALQRLSAAQLPAEEAALLDVTPGAAALWIERVSFLTNGQPVEFTRSWYRGDTYDFVAELIAREDGRIA